MPLESGGGSGLKGPKLDRASPGAILPFNQRVGVFRTDKFKRNAKGLNRWQFDASEAT